MTECTCLKCGKSVKGENPVWLLISPTGRIEGPYHPTCAYFVTLEPRYYYASARVVVANDATTAARVGKTT